MASTRAGALFLLGDLFEAWIGDDAAAAPGFEADCAAVLTAAARRLPVFFIAGNRDFLVGRRLAQNTGLTLLTDPTVVSFGANRWLLSHGDALCLGDTEYLAFRSQVRQDEWQRQFLALPIEQRRGIARSMRTESEQRKTPGRVYADVDTAAALAWLQAADAPVLVHGHTHLPAEHALDATHRRIVLTDWDLDAQPPRAEALRIGVDGDVQRIGMA